MKTYVTLTMLILLSPAFLNTEAQQMNDSLNPVRPFQVTFITPLGTNGAASYRIANEFSFNILAGINGGVDGFELGGLVNIDHGYVKGFQLSGLGNIVSGQVHALQIAGLGNINGDYSEGVQVAGVANVIGGRAESIGIAGFGNVSAELDGAQISGFGNISGSSEGLQAAGFGNMAGDITGAQVSGFINTADDVEGVQIAGFINHARNVKGLMLAGFINICDSLNGIPIAPLNIVKKNGYRRFELSVNENVFMNFSLKTGVHKFYTLFSVGFKPGPYDYSWNFGYGAGTSVMLGEKNSLDIEAHVYTIERNFFKHWEYNQLNQLAVNFNLQVSESLSFFAGPSFNFLIADNPESSHEISPTWSFRITGRRKVLSSWFGFNIGLRI